MPGSLCPGPTLAWPRRLCEAFTARSARASFPSVGPSALLPSPPAACFSVTQKECAI